MKPGVATVDFYPVHMPGTNPLAETLITLGHEVYEALAISEVMALAEQHPASLIVITSDVDQNRASIIQRHYMRFACIVNSPLCMFRLTRSGWRTRNQVCGYLNAAERVICLARVS